MWDLFCTRDSSLINKSISDLLKERNRKDSEGKRIVEVSEELLNQLSLTHYLSKNKVKALFLLPTS